MRLFGFRVTPDSDIDDTRISILDHLEELRGRLLKSIAAIAVLFPFCWYVCADVIDWFLEVVCVDLPRVQTLAVMELFFTQMKVSFFMALILAYPVVAFQAWRFVAPGLYRHERFYMSRFVIASTALFISGGEMALFYVFPRVVQFGAGMAQGKIEVAPQLSSVISLAAWLMLGFGVMFQLPIVVYLLAITGLVSVETMRKARPIIVIVIFTLAAILTPTPDIVTQCALAIPSYLLFEASILFTDVAVRRKRRREEEEKRQEEEEQQQRAQQEREAAGPAPESQALLTEAQPPADSSATVPPATTPDPAAALALDVTAPVEPPTESPPDTAPQALPGQYPAEATPDSPAREEPAGQTSWERWYGNVEEPPESLPAAAPGTAPVPGTTDLARDDLDTLGSGPV